MSKQQSMSTTAQSLYQSFDQDSTLGDSSQYFSAVESDDDFDKTIENENAQPPPMDVSPKPKKRVSFIPASTNRYSSLTQKTMNREFQKKLRDNRIAREKGASNGINISSSPETLDCSEDNKENFIDIGEQNMDLKLSSTANEQKNMAGSLNNNLALNEIVCEADAGITAPKNVASEIEVITSVEEIAVTKEVTSSNVSEVTEGLTAGDVPSDEFLQELSEAQGTVIIDLKVDAVEPKMINAPNNLPEMRNTVKSARQKLIEDTKRHQSRMSTHIRPTFGAPPKPPTIRKSMAPIRNIIDRANAIVAAESFTTSMPGNT